MTPIQEPVAASIQDSANDLSVGVGKTVLIDCAFSIKRVANNMPEVAIVNVTSPTEVMVQGKTPGETSLIIWDSHGGRQFYNVMVRANATVLNDNLDAIRRELRTELPGQPLKITSENGTIFLRGTVKSLENSTRAEKIAKTGGKIVNLLDVEVPDSEPQILLKVRFMSVDHTKSSQLGMNIFSSGFANTIGGISTGSLTTTTSSTASDTTVTGGTTPTNLSVFYPGLNLGATVQALQTNVGGQVLAEPNIVALNGKQASFLAGGEYPFPVVQGGGSSNAISLMFKEYGIRLNFIPTITPRGTIRLQVAPEVSALDFSDAIEVSGYEVPAITTRKMQTEVELSDGQSFVLGGLIDNTESQTFTKIPFLGDIPVLGKFFQAQTKSRANSELLVIVSPEIVAPIQAGVATPELKFPAKWLPANTPGPLNNPDAKTAANSLPSAPPTISIEKLKKSLEPEKPLVVEGASGGFGGASSSTAATSSTSSTSSEQ
jgi:pilus assembly protein CpaC